MNDQEKHLPVPVKEKETSDEMIRMKARTFVAMLFSIIVGTNSLSIIYQKIERNAEQQAYDKERGDRKDERILEEGKIHLKITNLERDLKECQESKK